MRHFDLEDLLEIRGEPRRDVDGPDLDVDQVADDLREASARQIDLRNSRRQHFRLGPRLPVEMAAEERFEALLEYRRYKLDVTF